MGYGNRKIGLIVDHLEGKQEIVIKSLEQNYATVEGLSGASILGDGSICLILDIASMINRVISEQDRLSRMQRQRVIEKKAAQVEEVKEIADLSRSSAESREPAGRKRLMPVCSMTSSVSSRGARQCGHSRRTRR